MDVPNLTVGKVAERCGVKVSTLHFYEEKGLIRSWRNQGNQRRYKRDVLRRISVIKAAQKMGISLENIRQALSCLPDSRTPNKKDWEKLANFWREDMNQRIAYMEKLRDSLTGCIGCGCLSMETCPIYNNEDELSKQGTGAILLEKEAGE
ncbi:redox-sensitive transcriptional activator SoxR [Sansalvadorimonas sp. 2012CJ34-2]|uniref:Redox-sensitive transcriptional activator SoxR n=1 Tax=Parendozoicomonas callyspongiae TaxID=2942213 RepID=A0ABT0PKM8_9GAMM|nr:redox-sensitive transcriptional activator SoxR [Sansalvadorimonas sp. 2012CJ34-2]MCL6271944.1 redox-sensitive transcriptional activator SoxR [Sansalvadorimonas sp. 2012CJ34-2]